MITMIKVQQYDKVILADGRRATVVEVLEDDVAYLVDVEISDTEWDTIEVRQKDILDVID